MIDLPGRVFISYTANTSSDSGVFGKFKVPGSSQAIVELFDIEYTKGITDDELLTLKLKSPTKSSDALLVEVQLLRKNVLKGVSKSGVGDVVVLENVLYSRDQDPFLNDKNYVTSNCVGLTISGGDGDLFLSDKASSLSMEYLDLSVSGNGNLQLELAALNVTKALFVSTGLAANVSVFADKLSADVDAAIGTKKAVDKLCIDAKNNVNVSVTAGESAVFASYPGKKSGTLMCVKLDIPTRVPVSGSSDSADATKSTGSSSSTVTPVPTSKAEKSAAPATSGLSPALEMMSELVATLLMIAI